MKGICWNLGGKGLAQIQVERGRRSAEFAENKIRQLLSSLEVGIIVGCIYGVTIRDEVFEGDVMTEILF